MQSLVEKGIKGGAINNAALDGAYIIVPEAVGEGKSSDELISFDEAYNIVNQDMNAKVVIVSFLNDIWEKMLCNNESKKQMLRVLQTNPNVVFLTLPASREDWNNISFKSSNSSQKVSNNELIDAMHSITKGHLLIIRHSLQPGKIKDPYHPNGEREQHYLDEAFELTKKYFP